MSDRLCGSTYPSLKLENQVSHPYKATDQTIVFRRYIIIYFFYFFLFFIFYFWKVDAMTLLNSGRWLVFVLLFSEVRTVEVYI
jgi:hypothetical protein